MNTQSSSPVTQPSKSKLAWAVASVLALALGAIALSVTPAQDSVQGAKSHVPTTPGATVSSRIDHSAIDWDKHPASPEEPGVSVAAYEVGS